MGVKGARTGRQACCDMWRVNQWNAGQTDVKEDTKSGRTSECSGERIGYHEELRLRRRVTGAQVPLKLASEGIEQDEVHK